MGLSGLKRADALFHNLVAENKVPGMSVTVLQNGKTLLQKGYGHGNLEKRTIIVPEHSVFRIASISKCITGLTLGKMVEDGLVDLDASFYKYVPYYPKKKYDFTLRQLAGHTAGIRGYRGKEYALDKPYSIKESIEVFKNDPLLFEPGKGYLYNSFDFVLLSLAMQEASGVAFEDYVKKEVLTPLDLSAIFPPGQMGSPWDSSIKHGLKLTEHYTTTASGFKKAIPVNNFYKLAGGGYLSTSSDIAKLGQAILDGKLLKKETYRQILSSQTIQGKPTYYGLGFQVSQDTKGRSFVGHLGNSVGAYTNFFVYPEAQTVISILINCTDPKVQEILNTAVNCLLPENYLA